MNRLILALMLAFFACHAWADDYANFSAAGDNFVSTASQLLESNLKEKAAVVWLGKVLDVSIYKNKDGATSIEWLCEQHAFDSKPNLPLKEPFIVRSVPSGKFVITLNLPTLTIDEAKEKVVNGLKSPSWILVHGEPVFVQKFKESNAVYLHSLNAAISDTMVVKYAK